MPWPPHSPSTHSLHFCLHSCKIILYLPHIFTFFCKLHLVITILKTQWELIMAWRRLRYSSEERWRTAPGESPPYLIDILLLLQLPVQLCSGFALWTLARYFCGEHLLTLHIYIPFLTDFSTFNSAVVDFNSFLSVITKGLKATWQLFTLTLQNQSTKLLYNLLYFCPSANFIKNTVSGNIQLFFIIQVFLLNLFIDQVFIHFYSNRMIDWF